MLVTLLNDAFLNPKSIVNLIPTGYLKNTTIVVIQRLADIGKRRFNIMLNSLYGCEPPPFFILIDLNDINFCSGQFGDSYGATSLTRPLTLGHALAN